MYINSHSTRGVAIFSSQFEPDGADFLYRKSMKGPAIRVTQAERDDFVTAFGRRVRYAMWSFLGAIFVLIGLLMFLLPDGSRDGHKVSLLIGTTLILLAFVGAYYLAWTAPARALDRRPLAGAARTRTEVRQLTLAKLTYGQLALAPAAAVYLVWTGSKYADVLHNWGLLWLIVPALLIIGAAIQAVRKWLLEHNGVDDV